MLNSLNFEKLFDEIGLSYDSNAADSRASFSSENVFSTQQDAEPQT